MIYSRVLIASATAMLGVAGCNSPSGSPYPSGGGSGGMTNPSQPGTALQVPAGARLVAGSTTPPLPSFSLSEPGVLYIFDATTNKVVKVTTVTATQNPINLSSMPDVGAVLNTSDQYEVYFVPLTKATTLPSPLGGS